MEQSTISAAEISINDSWMRCQTIETGKTNMTGEKFADQIHQAVWAGTTDTDKQESFTSFDEIWNKILRHLYASFDASPATFVGECIFRVGPAIVSIISMSTWEIVVEFGTKSQHYQTHTCHLDANAELNRVSKVFYEFEELNIMKWKQQRHLCTIYKIIFSR